MGKIKSRLSEIDTRIDSILALLGIRAESTVPTLVDRLATLERSVQGIKSTHSAKTSDLASEIYALRNARHIHSGWLGKLEGRLQKLEKTPAIEKTEEATK